MNKCWIICFLFLVIGVKANANTSVASLTADKVERILWLTPERSQGIVYARFDLFVLLRDTITNAIHNSQSWPTKEIELARADMLLLKRSNQQQIEQVFLLPEGISYQGMTYPVSLEVLANLKRVNDQRIEKGDLIINRWTLSG